MMQMILKNLLTTLIMVWVREMLDNACLLVLPIQHAAEPCVTLKAVFDCRRDELCAR